MSSIATPPGALSEAAARRVTKYIKHGLLTLANNIEVLQASVEQARTGEAWKALGYPSWTAYCAAEFTDAAVQLDAAMRGQVLQALSSAGMSSRAIAPIVGVSKDTVQRHLAAQVSHDETPAEVKVTGLDGKQYVRTQTKQKPRRRPLPDAYRDAVWDLQKLVEKFQRLHADDRFKQNREALKHYWRALSNASALLADMEAELGRDLLCTDCSRIRGASADDSLCTNCRRRKDPNVLGPCEHCGATFADCTCDD